jgi:enamine deaminase RidA (YjgF/YER057c/UK114 family)
MLINFNYITGQGFSFEEQLEHLFENYIPKGDPIRLVFFGNPLDRTEYLLHQEMIINGLHKKFGKRPPVFTYVAQPPIEKLQLAMEVFELKNGDDTQIIYKQKDDLPYIIVQTDEMKALFFGGAMGSKSDESIQIQSELIFSGLEEIFMLEKMPISSIVRQWNYIEQITHLKGGNQNYQNFNDARSHFYQKTKWSEGFPAATGIGISFGGVIIDLDAIYTNGSGIKIIPLNNTLQVPAHGYSHSVLIGPGEGAGIQLTTPKFERAKVVLFDKEGVIYISGTAAIRGEMSLMDKGIEEQTRITLENIEHLISPETLAGSGAGPFGKIEITSLRIYLKEESFFKPCKRIVDDKYAGVPAVYLKADICREELLVEIEGLARVYGEQNQNEKEKR